MSSTAEALARLTEKDKKESKVATKGDTKAKGKYDFGETCRRFCFAFGDFGVSPLKWRCLQKPKKRRQLQSQSQHQKHLWSEELRIFFKKWKRQLRGSFQNRNDGKVEIICHIKKCAIYTNLSLPKNARFYQRRRVMPPCTTKVGTTGSGSAGHSHRPWEGGCWRVDYWGYGVVPTYP